MRLTRIRWLKLLVVATFLWSNVAVAAHACLTVLAAQGLNAVVGEAHEGCNRQQQAPGSRDDPLCIAHCIQADQSFTQKLAIDAPAAAPAPVLFDLLPAVAVRPAAAVVALAVPIVGPPLTILLQNFRI